MDVFQDQRVPGGAPLNVARHLKAFGIEPFLISRVGLDQSGRQLLERAQAFDLTTAGVQTDAWAPTGQVLVRETASGHHFDILPAQAYDFIASRPARKFLAAIQPDLVYFGTLAQRAKASAHALKTLLSRIQAPRFLDINLRSPWYDTRTIEKSLRFANILKLNEDELKELSRRLRVPRGPVVDIARDLCQRFRLEGVVVTAGPEGAWLYSPGGLLRSAAPVPPQGGMIDTVGAGDGFAAIFLLGRLHGWDVATTLERANAFAGAICTLRGAIPEDDHFYTPFLKEWQVQ